MLIEGVIADGRHFNPAPELRLPSNTSHLQIDFAALTLADPMRVRFRYRLEGFDHSWVDGGTGRQAVYTNLPPRAYRFRVVASNNDGIWNQPGNVLDFAIEPMFYQTTWFYVLSVVTVALLVWASWQFRVRQVRRQFALVLAERIRMSRAIHDTLLQGLVGIALQFDNLANNLDSSSSSARNHFVRIRRQVEEYIREARQSIWDLRSPRLETHDLAVALRETGERALSGTSAQFEVAITGSPHRCPPPVEEQVLLIGQEALNNAARHARARRVRLELHYVDSRLRLRVSDDGCGFDLEEAYHTNDHYGLMSMRERAAQVGGELNISTRPGAGTEVEAIVPTR